MLDSIYQIVQALMNKEQLGYFKPKDFNLFAGLAQRKEYNQLFIDLKLNERKQNWHLDEKNLANLAENSRQLLEYFTVIEDIAGYPDPLPDPLGDTFYAIPSNVEFIQDVFVSGAAGKPITKVPYSDYKNLQRNIYASPTDCSPICSKVGSELKVSPVTVVSIEMHYLRQPLTPKWTFDEDANGKPFFNPTALDFQDFDLPPSSKDRLISSMSEMAGITTRDQIMIQSANQDQQQDVQQDNRQ